MPGVSLREKLRISVVTPSYNQAVFLDSCIYSVISQDYKEVEYIVMDGGSVDGSQAIVNYHSKEISKAVIGADLGQSDAINKGIAVSSGEIVCWVNSDDALLPAALSTVASYFDLHPDCDWLVGHCLFTDVYGKPGWFCEVTERQPEDYLRFWDGIFLPQPSVFFRRSLWDRVGGLNISYKYAMDLDLWLRFLSESPLHCLGATLSINRVHGATKTANGRENAISELAKIITSSKLNERVAYTEGFVEESLRRYFVSNELDKFRSELTFSLRGLMSYKLDWKQKVLAAAITNKNLLRYIFGRSA